MKVNVVGYFEIQSSDPRREIEFYGNLFGWTFMKNVDNQIEYYRIDSESIPGGLLMRPKDIPVNPCGINSFVCSIQVEDFDETSERILQLGGQIAMPKFAVAGRCWQGYFRDQDNNTFGIFEVDLNAK